MDRYEGKKLAQLEISMLFVLPTKNLGAFGDGGMITTNDDNVAHRRALGEHGMAQNGAKARFILEGTKMSCWYGITDGLYNPYKYYNYLIAHNSCLDALQAVILSIKLITWMSSIIENKYK